MFEVVKFVVYKKGLRVQKFDYYSEGFRKKCGGRLKILIGKGLEEMLEIKEGRGIKKGMVFVRRGLRFKQ